MILLALKLQNFHRVQDCYVKFPQSGLIYIYGLNQDVETADSNGSGKSLVVLDGIAYALFGKTVRPIRKPKLKFHGEPLSIIMFKKDKIKYCVKRKRFLGKTILYLKVNDGKYKKIQQDKLEEIYGFNFDTFMMSVLSRYDERSKFLFVQKHRIKKLIFDILGVENIHKLSEEFRTKIVELNSEIDVYNNSKSKINGKLDFIKETLKLTRLKKTKGFDRTTAANELEKLSKKIDLVSKKITVIESKKSKIKEEISENTISLRVILTSVNDFKSKILNMKSLKSGVRCDRCYGIILDDNKEAYIEKIEKKIRNLEIKHPYLMQSPEMDAILARFSKKVAKLLEEFKKPLEQKKKRAPVVVPL